MQHAALDDGLGGYLLKVEFLESIS